MNKEKVERTKSKYQASVVHGNTSSKYCHVAVKQHGTIGLHSCVEQSYPPSSVTDEVVVSLEDGGEAKCSHSTCVLIVFQGSVILKCAIK